MSMPNESTPLTSHYHDIFGVEKEVCARELAKNWGWIQLVGVLDVICGIMALLSPIVATEFAYIFIIASLFVVGVVHISGLWFAEHRQKVASLLVGITQLILAIALYFNPLEGLTVFTIFVALLFMLEGVFKIGMALQNRDMPGWGWTLASGASAIAFSVIVISAMPMSALYTLGILLGVNLVSTGTTRVFLSCVGRSIASAHIESASDPILGV